MHPVLYNGNGTHEELVDEKGSHQDILKFASRADIVVCCLAMNKETVTTTLISFEILFFEKALTLHLLVFQAGIVDDAFISSMRKVCDLIYSN